MNTGFFTVDTLNEMDKADSLVGAKVIAFQAVKNQPNAKDNNIKKANAAIKRAQSKTQLMISCANFLLSHPSENLGMKKGE
jgi:hypothetical protein